MMKYPIWLQQIHRFPGPGVTPPEKVCQDPIVCFHPRKKGLLEDCLAESNKVKDKCQQRSHGVQILFHLFCLRNLYIFLSHQTQAYFL